MTIPPQVILENPGVGDWCILNAYRGSIVHGTYTPSTDPDSIDDKDTMAICVPPLDCYFGLNDFASRGTQEVKHGEWDIVVYEVRKALHLLSQGNPNILAMLWLKDSMYLKRTAPGDLLIANRELFATRAIFHSYTGYARGQLHRMEHGAKQDYMGEKRRALVEKYGFDVKNAAHLIRLLRIACEFLSTGELQVDRGGIDATELIDIKRGEWTLERVKAEADRLFVRAEGAYDRSGLPSKPDRDRINDLCVEVVRMVHDVTPVVRRPEFVEQLRREADAGTVAFDTGH